MGETFLQKVSGNKFLLATLVLSLSMPLLVFPALPYNGLEILDIKFSYDAVTATQTLDGLGKEGRAFYMWGSSFLDMLYPLFYGSFFAGLLYRWRPSDKFTIFAYIPILTLFLDIAENTAITGMISSFPSISESQASTASMLTSAKWITVYIFYLLSLGFGAVKLYRFLKMRQKSA